jgi:extradiol dioxygenase family protein
VSGPAFHLAFPVTDLAATRAFYTDVLGCREGRRSETWVDFDFFGHQLSAHLTPKSGAITGVVDGRTVPIPHFGVILRWTDFQRMAERIRERGTQFLVEPTVRFEGQIGEQATMFVLDPSGNALEFKSYRDSAQAFAP